jgi:hypothetical protein
MDFKRVLLPLDRSVAEEVTAWCILFLPNVSVETDNGDLHIEIMRPLFSAWPNRARHEPVGGFEFPEECCFLWSLALP